VDNSSGAAGVVAVEVVIAVVSPVITRVTVVTVVVTVPHPVVEGDAPPITKIIVMAIAEVITVTGPDTVVEKIIGDDVDAVTDNHHEDVLIIVIAVVKVFVISDGVPVDRTVGVIIGIAIVAGILSFVAIFRFEVFTFLAVGICHRTGKTQHAQADQGQAQH